jgi:hypothetical protein
MTVLTERCADKIRGVLSFLDRTCPGQKVVMTDLKLETLFVIIPIAEPLTMTT